MALGAARKQKCNAEKTKKRRGQCHSCQERIAAQEPNHWHLCVRPKMDGEMSRFAHWLTLTHTQRYNAYYDMLRPGLDRATAGVLELQ